MAPEQLEGGEADTRTDIFAFGVVLYEMVTGKRAFDGKVTPASSARFCIPTPHHCHRFSRWRRAVSIASSRSVWRKTPTIAGRRREICWTN